MASRALIVAIEDYPKVPAGGALASKLDGTLRAGLDFKEWLLAKWAQEGVVDQHVIFCSEPMQRDGRAGTSVAIKEAMLELQSKGASQTEELYVYLSGHGFTFSNVPGVKKSIFIASDFANPKTSGGACLPVDEIILWLSTHLGTGLHAYFINACRNVLDGKTITIGPILPFDPNATGEASTFVLNAAEEGDVTPVNSPFQRELMAGLKGQGRAKEWDDDGGDSMRVRYWSLRKHLSKKLKRLVDGDTTGPDTDMVFATIAPAPTRTCTIRIEGDGAAAGAITYKRNRDTVATETPLAGTTTVLTLKPDVYQFAIKPHKGAVDPPQSALTDLYDDAVLDFKLTIDSTAGEANPERIGGGGNLEGLGGLESLEAWKNLKDLRELEALAKSEFSLQRQEKAVRPTYQDDSDRTSQAPSEGAFASTKALLDLVVPPDCSLELVNTNTRGKEIYSSSQSVEVDGDDYLAVLKDRDGRTIGETEIDVVAGARIPVNLAGWQSSIPHQSIARYLETGTGWADFSESLGGPVVDPDLDLWLALAGAGRIFLSGPNADYQKLARLPLHDFRQEKPGASPIYILAGSEKSLKSLKVGVSDGPEVRWRAAKSPAGMDAIYEAYIPAEPGPHLLSFRIDKNPAYTVATCASANRAMLVTISFDGSDAATISQYLLPIGHLTPRLPEYAHIEARRLHHRPLEDVRFLATAMRAFRRRRMVLSQEAETDLLNILYAKWVDPITSALVAYEMLRRGTGKDLSVVVANMNTYFADLPDSQALARLAGRAGPHPAPWRGTPLFLDGLKAYPDDMKSLPLPASNLDYTSPWTAWWAAVK